MGSRFDGLGPWMYELVVAVNLDDMNAGEVSI